MTNTHTSNSARIRMHLSGIHEAVGWDHAGGVAASRCFLSLFRCFVREPMGA